MKGDIIIKKSEDKRRLFENFFKAYRKSLKPPETEEFVNQYLNRPAAYLVAQFFHKLKASPHLVTVISMGFGISSGFFFARGTYASVMCILLELMIIFDCADGQLARLIDTSSKIGKTLDGLADMCTHFSIFYGVAFALYMKTGSFFPFFLAVLSQLSLYLHIALYDHFKNVFISVTRPDYGDKLESIDELGKRIRDFDPNGSQFQLKVLKLYYKFYKLESIVVSIGYPPFTMNFYELYPHPEKIDPYTREQFYREMRFSTKLWSMIGDTIHLSVFVVCGVINRIDLIFPIILIYTNFMMFIALLFQRVKFRKIGLEREILWQERFD